MGSHTLGDFSIALFIFSCVMGFCNPLLKSDLISGWFLYLILKYNIQFNANLGDLLTKILLINYNKLAEKITVNYIVNLNYWRGNNLLPISSTTTGVSLHFMFYVEIKGSKVKNNIRWNWMTDHYSTILPLFASFLNRFLTLFVLTWGILL